MPDFDEVAVEHAHFMRRCLELAAAAREQGDTPVGCVVVLDGAVPVHRPGPSAGQETLITLI
jgi:tRNA(Arg) A34 adenosine deaminase TadA